MKKYATKIPEVMRHFAEVPDPRVVGRCEHKLFDILFIAVAATIAACDDWKMVVTWAHKREEWLRKFCELPNGIPSRFVFVRVFRKLDPEALNRAFAAWMKEIQELTAGDVVAIDGKTLRRSFDRAPGGKGAIHMVSAWLSRNGVVLGRREVADKSNEITAIPELLRLLELNGALVTIDAMGCQREIAGQLVAGDADYLLAVKENQSKLLEDVKRTFSGSAEPRSVEMRDVGHGRFEVREYWQCADLSRIRAREEWAGLRTVGKVRSFRMNADGTMNEEERYYISSLPLGVKRMARGIRAHWGIENELHYVLDLSFNEDQCRIRKGHGAENAALLRHVARNYLSAARYLDCGVKNRRLLADIDEKVLQKILGF